MRRIDGAGREKRAGGTARSVLRVAWARSARDHVSSKRSFYPKHGRAGVPAPLSVVKMEDYWAGQWLSNSAIRIFAQQPQREPQTFLVTWQAQSYLRRARLDHVSKVESSHRFSILGQSRNRQPHPASIRLGRGYGMRRTSDKPPTH